MSFDLAYHLIYLIRQRTDLCFRFDKFQLFSCRIRILITGIILESDGYATDGELSELTALKSIIGE